MTAEGSVTHWFEQVREGDSLAARALWERYFPALVRLAREKLRGVPCRASDEEDVASSVMESLFRAAARGRFPDLADRDDLWRLLLWMTARKVIDLKRRETRQRRGSGHVRGESALGEPGSPDDSNALAEVIGDSPTPEFAAMMLEEYERLLARLGEADLQALASAKLEGYTNEEIAAATRLLRADHRTPLALDSQSGSRNAHHELRFRVHRQFVARVCPGTNRSRLPGVRERLEIATGAAHRRVPWEGGGHGAERVAPRAVAVGAGHLRRQRENMAVRCIAGTSATVVDAASLWEPVRSWRDPCCGLRLRGMKRTKKW